MTAAGDYVTCYIFTSSASQIDSCTLMVAQGRDAKATNALETCNGGKDVRFILIGGSCDSRDQQLVPPPPPPPPGGLPPALLPAIATSSRAAVCAFTNLAGV